AVTARRIFHALLQVAAAVLDVRAHGIQRHPRPFTDGGVWRFFEIEHSNAYPLAFRQSRQAVAQLVSLVRFDVEVRESVILMQERRVLHKDVVDGYRVPGRPLPEDLQAVVVTHAVEPARKETHLLVVDRAP